MIIVNDIRLPLLSAAELEAEAKKQALVRLGLSPAEVPELRLHRLSYDCRRSRVSCVCSAALSLASHEAESAACARDARAVLRKKARLEPRFGEGRLEHRPVVAGFGPAGMFAAYILAKYGYRPLVLERGADIERRGCAVEGFFSGGELDENSNVQFGEGGAGAFSDGKLTTRINDP
ncbi:MAG: hypothetical protein Q4B42_00625, partial [Oscillospiraceae bacterium]|nr:hypothetical protein [Oscillospiraceae bacterium]